MVPENPRVAGAQAVLVTRWGPLAKTVQPSSGQESEEKRGWRLRILARTGQGTHRRTPSDMSFLSRAGPWQREARRRTCMH